DVKRRVPEDGESIVASDRKTTVRLDPGDDSNVAGVVGARGWGLDLSYQVGRRRHFGDRYHGSLAGDYATLSDDSDTTQLYQRAGLAFDTIDAYKRRRFPVPFIIALAANEAIEGRNATRDRYYEVTLTSFFAGRKSR